MRAAWLEAQHTDYLIVRLSALVEDQGDTIKRKNDCWREILLYFTLRDLLEGTLWVMVYLVISMVGIKILHSIFEENVGWEQTKWRQVPFNVKTKPAKSVSFNLDDSSATAKATGSGSNTSKKKASSSAKNRSQHSKSSAVVEKKKKLLRDSLQRKHEIEVKTLEWQEKLFEGAVGVDVIIEAAKHFQPHHFTEVVIERNVLNYCGYPLCSRPPATIKGKYRISSSKQKVVDVSELKQYCSKQCLAAAKYYKNQLNEDPVYLRDMEGMASVDVLLMDIIDDSIATSRYLATAPSTSHQILSNHIKSLLESIPAPSTPIVIKENDPDDMITTPQMSTNQYDNDFENIEGFKIRISASLEKIEEPTTMVLKSLPEIGENALVQQETDSVEIDKELSRLKVTTENVQLQAKDSTAYPKLEAKTNLNTIKAVRSQSKISSTLNLFGSIFTMMNAVITEDTKRFVRGQETLVPISDSEVSWPISDSELMQNSPETSAQYRFQLTPELRMRQDIFADRMIQTATALSQILALQPSCVLSLHESLRSLFRTFNLNSKNQLLSEISSTESIYGWVVMVLCFRALSKNIENEYLECIIDSDQWKQMWNVVFDIDGDANRTLITMEEVQWMEKMLFWD